MKEENNSINEPSSAYVPEEVFGQFKTMADLNKFVDSVFKRGVETMLKAELTDHLGYDKHSVDGKNTGNSRNGSSSKIIKTSSGELQIEIPRDRNNSFEPVIIPKRQRVIDKIENVVVSLYARGMSTRDIEQQIKEIYGVTLS